MVRFATCFSNYNGCLVLIWPNTNVFIPKCRKELTKKSKQGVSNPKHKTRFFAFFLNLRSPFHYKEKLKRPILR